MHTLAREIERLAPAVDREARPDNSDCPWLAGDDVIAPGDFDFPNLSLLTAARGRALLKRVFTNPWHVAVHAPPDDDLFVGRHLKYL